MSPFSKAPVNNKVFVAAFVAFASIAIVMNVNAALIGNHQGYAPKQPIAFSHRLHAGELKINCQYCHYGARTSRTAGIPPASICMNCHKVVRSGYDAVLSEREAAKKEKREEKVLPPSAEIQKLYDALALDASAQPIPNKQPKPIHWIRVHNLPDFVYFNHSVHVAAGVVCQTCHGPVQTLERMSQFSDLSMGWCLDCHRTTQVGELPSDHASTNCGSCHY